jgi:hypothetical protein
MGVKMRPSRRDALLFSTSSGRSCLDFGELSRVATIISPSGTVSDEVIQLRFTAILQSLLFTMLTVVLFQ